MARLTTDSRTRTITAEEAVASLPGKAVTVCGTYIGVVSWVEKVGRLTYSFGLHLRDGSQRLVENGDDIKIVVPIPAL